MKEKSLFYAALELVHEGKKSQLHSKKLSVPLSEKCAAYDISIIEILMVKPGVGFALIVMKKNYKLKLLLNYLNSLLKLLRALEQSQIRYDFFGPR